MSDSANVRSIEVIRQFRAAVTAFLEEANGSLEMMQMELQRVFDWIDHERPHYWSTQTRRAYDLVSQTRVELNNCLMRTVGGRPPACVEQKEAHAAAKRRVQHCREQIERVKHWGFRIHHEADEFRGRMAGVRRCLDHDVPKLLALLERTASVLESYADIASPDDEAEEPPREREGGTEGQRE